MRIVAPTHLLAPQLVAYLDVGQDHETQRCKVGDDEEAGMVHLGVDLLCQMNKSGRFLTSLQAVTQEDKKCKLIFKFKLIHELQIYTSNP